jgi:oligoribonuclease NrnB/cAMP/cGMP phosphodiesterase (DHH superfamily)
MKTLVIYHGKCPDGFGAALSAWLKFKDTADYLPAEHGAYPSPRVTGRDVYILDFSFPRPTLEQMRADAKSLTILDHHKTAKEALHDFPGAVFDMTKSGARLAWEHFHPGAPVPRLIQYIEDRDLYNWRYEETERFTAVLDTLPFTFEAWHAFLLKSEERDEMAQILVDGQAMTAKFNALAEEQVLGAEPVTVNGILGLKLNAGGRFTDKLGELMHARTNAFGMLWRIQDGMLRVSFRSARGGVDVSALAKTFGGGGHAAAASFRIPLDTPRFEHFFRTYILGPGE